MTTYKAGFRRVLAMASGQGDAARRVAFSAMPILILVLLIVSGCASMSKDECLSADWYAIGVADGSNGYELSRLGDHRKSCAEVGVSPDADRYAQGRMNGLEAFCTREKGYYQGENGYSYRGVCPPHLEPYFMQGYLAGQAVYKTKQEIARLDNELKKVRIEIASVRANLDQGYVVAEDGTSHEISKYERDAMYERLLFLGRDEGRLEGEIAALRNSLAGA